jgi:hypothetical protein
VPSSAEAHQSRARAPKATQADDPQELANADLAKWNANYLANMAEATKIKQQHKAVALARKNAAFWVLGQGIAGVGICSGDDRVPNPLAIFSGCTLLEALTGRESSPSGVKRTRSLLDDLDEEGKARRVRARGEDEQELGRGDDAVGNDAEEFIPGAEDGMVFPGEDVVRMDFFLMVITLTFSSARISRSAGMLQSLCMGSTHLKCPGMSPYLAMAPAVHSEAVYQAAKERAWSLGPHPFSLAGAARDLPLQAHCWVEVARCRDTAVLSFPSKLS